MRKSFSTARLISTFVAATALRLVEEGRLHLEDRVADHVPAAAIDGIANARSATVRQLLQGYYELEVGSSGETIWVPIGGVVPE